MGKQTGNRGFGLKTMRPIKKGEFVLEYRGEVRRAAARSFTLVLLHHRALTLPATQIISRNESYRRVLTDYKDSAS